MSRVVGGTPQMKREFASVPQKIEGLGARVYVRHVKTRDEDPWWPTAAYGTRAMEMDQRRKNVWTGPDRKLHTTFIPANSHPLNDAVGESKDAHLTMIGYFTTEFDRRIAMAHPDWVCRQPGGAPNDLAYRATMGTVLDITSPYRDIVTKELMEVIRHGVHGIYIDRALIAPWGDSSDYSLALYTKETGRRRALNAANGSLKTYSDWFKVESYPESNIHWYRWRIKKISETLQIWRDAIHSVDPETVLIASVSNLPALVRPDASTQWCAHADSAKSETDISLSPSRRNRIGRAHPDLVPASDDARALGWAVTRDAASGRPFHVWSGTALPTTDMARMWAAAIMTYGGVAALDIYELADTDRRNRSRPFTSDNAAAAVFELSRQASPYLANATPLRHALVHINERARDQLLTRSDGVREATRRLVMPTIGAFGALTRTGICVGTIDDSQLSHDIPEEVQLLVLPMPHELTAAQQSVAQRFTARGGLVIDTGPAADWVGDTSNAESRLQQRAQSAISAAPVRMLAPGRQHMVAYRLLDDEPLRMNRLIVAVSDNFEDLSVAGGASEPRTSADVPSVDQAPGIRVLWKPHVMVRPVRATATEILTRKALEIGSDSGHSAISLPVVNHMSLIVIDN